MGNVLARDAALMRYLALPVRLFLGGRLGGGQQWFTWVHIDDAVPLFRKAIDGTVPDGVLNATSPGAVQQVDFARAMGKALHRPTWFPAPAWLIRLVLGEQAVLLLGSRRITSARASQLGYDFRYPTIGPALEDVLG
jgi:NAD dependent epimerase/dehydratase family enzyme